MFCDLMIRQLRHKWLSNVLLFLAMICLVSLYVFILNTHRFSIRSMRLIMKNMGLNQLLVPESANPIDAYLCTERQPCFPDEVTRTLAAHRELLSKYYVSVLQKRIQVKGQTLLLTGIEPVARADETTEKSNPVKAVNPGHARLGSAASECLGVRTGQVVELLGERFAVESVVKPRGSLDDYRVFLNLPDAQRLLKQPGKINCVWSFECLHVGGSLEHINEYQRLQLNTVLPGYRQMNVAAIAEGRHHARRMTEKYLYYLLGIVALVTVLIVVISGMQEVADRKFETGILVALGAGYTYITGLYFAKMLLLSALAAVIGFIVGGYASVWLTSPFLVTNTRQVAVVWSNLPGTIAMVAVVALFAEVIPMVRLLRMDPSAILSEE